MYPVTRLFAKNACSHLRRAVLVCAVLLCAAGAWGATNFRWGRTATGNWAAAGDTGTWQKSDSGVFLGDLTNTSDNPTSADTVYINTDDVSGSIEITLTADVQANTLYIESSSTASVTINLNGHTLTTNTLVLGNKDGSGDTVTLVINGSGSVVADGMSYKNTATNSSLSLTSGATLSVTNDISNNSSGQSGTLTISADATSSLLASGNNAFAATTLVDTNEYHWKSSHADMVWTNPANWETSAGEAVLHYPGYADGDKAVFENAGTVTLTGFDVDADGNMLHIEADNSSVTMIRKANATAKASLEIELGYVCLNNNRSGGAVGSLYDLIVDEDGKFQFNGGALTVEGNLEIYNDGEFIVANNALFVEGDVLFVRGSLHNTDAGGGSITVAGDTTVGQYGSINIKNAQTYNGSVTLNSDGKITCGAATVTFNGSVDNNDDGTITCGTGDVIFNDGIYSEGTITGSSGTITFNGYFDNCGNLTASSTATIFYGGADFLNAGTFTQPATGAVYIFTKPDDTAEKHFYTRSGLAFGDVYFGGNVSIHLDDGDVTAANLRMLVPTDSDDNPTLIPFQTEPFTAKIVGTNSLTVTGETRLTRISDTDGVTGTLQVAGSLVPTGTFVMNSGSVLQVDAGETLAIATFENYESTTYSYAMRVDGMLSFAKDVTFNRMNMIIGSGGTVEASKIIFAGDPAAVSKGNAAEIALGFSDTDTNLYLSSLGTLKTGSLSVQTVFQQNTTSLIEITADGTLTIGDMAHSTLTNLKIDSGKTLTLAQDTVITGNVEIENDGILDANGNALTISGTSGSRAVLSGGGQFVVATDKFAGDYLSVGNDIEIVQTAGNVVKGAFDVAASDGTRTSVPSAGTAESDYVTVYNHGWKLKQFTFTWTGATSTDWATDTNWDIGMIPGVSATHTTDALVVIPDGKARYPAAGVAYTIETLTIGTSSASFHDATLTLASAALTVTGTTSGALTNYGTIVYGGTARIVDATSAAINDVAHGGTVEYSGTAQTITVFGGTADYANLTVSGTASTTDNITLNGSLTNTGTCTASAGAFTFTGTGASIAAPTGTLTLYDVIIAPGASVTTTDSFTVQHDWTNNGTFTATGGTITFSGAATVHGQNTFFHAVVTAAGETVTVSDANTFDTLSCTGAGLTVRFGAQKTQTVQTAFVSHGADGSPVVLTTDAAAPDADDDATWWIFDAPLTAVSGTDSTYTKVQYSTAVLNISSAWGSPATIIEGDGGSTVNWFQYVFYWFGKTDGAWTESTNWSLADTYDPANPAPRAPSNTSRNDDIVIAGDANDSGGNTLVLPFDIAVKSITVSADKLLDVADKNVTVTDTFENNGTVRMTGTQTITGTMINGAGSTGISTVEYYGAGISSLPWDGDASASGKQYVTLQFSAGAAGQESGIVTVSDTTTIANGSGNALTLAGQNVFTGNVIIATDSATGGALALNSAGGFTLATAATDGTLICDSLTIMSDVTFAGGLLVRALYGVRARLTADGQWRAVSGDITFADTDFFIDSTAAAATLSVQSNLSCRNYYFYNGALSAPGIAFTTSADCAVWGSAYNPDDPRYSGTDTRFAYYPATSAGGGLAYYPAGGTAVTAGATSASFASVAGAVFTIGGNFYVNGADMTQVTLNLPDNSVSSPQCNSGSAPTATQWGIPYAVACNMTATSVTATGGWIAASATAQKVTDGGANTQWQFEHPQIASAYTVYDDVLALTFTLAVENSHDEIGTEIRAGSTHSVLTGGIWYDNDALSFTDVYADADCTMPLSGDIAAGTPVYVRTTNGTWNSDATGTSAGDAQSTDRAGAHQTRIPTLALLEGVLTAAEGHTMCANYGMGFEWDGSAYTAPTRYTDATDRCAPVLIAAYTGQELHTAYGGTAESQPAYDAHNFIELQYSEAVDIGDLTAAAGDINAQATSTFAAGEHGGHLTSNASGMTAAGLVTIANGSITAGNKADAAASPHALYRAFSTTAGGAAQAQTHRVRISVAGYVDGVVSAPVGTSSTTLADYRNWVGYIDASTTPAGTVTPLANAYVIDAAANAIDAAGATNHALPAVTVNARATGATTELYGAWDTMPPSFARYIDGINDDFQWVGADNERATYEIIGTVENDVHLQNVEFHLFDNQPAYQASEAYKWLARYGWMEGTSVVNGGGAPDTIGGARGLPVSVRQTTGGIRRSSLAGAASAFTYRYHVDGRDSTDRPFNTDESVAPVLQGVRSSLFRTETQPSTVTTDDGLYFSLYVNPQDTALPIRTRFVITYTPQNCYITDLAGNRLLQTDNGHEKVLNSIDVTPPAFALTLSPVADDKMYVTFTKQLTDERGHPLEAGSRYLEELPNEFEFIVGGNAETTDTEPIAVTSVQLVSSTSDYTILLFTLSQSVTLDNVERLWLRTKKIDDAKHKATNSISGSVEYATLIRDNIGNCMEAHTCHAFSDFALNAVNVLYAYTPELIDETTGEAIEKNLYGYAEEGGYAMHDFSAQAGNYGRLHAGKDITLQVQFVGGKDENGFFAPANGETMRLIPDLASHIQGIWKSDAYNDFIGADWRVWLTEQFDFIATSHNDAPLASADSPASVGDAEGLLWNFSLPDSTYGFKAGDEVQFIYKIYKNDAPILIDHNADGEMITPLYALWMPSISANIVPFVDLWSFRLSETKKQRGGVSILNNVINVSVKEQTVIQVDMPEDGNLNVYVMTLDGNIIHRLEHGRVSAGTHYYRWNGSTMSGIPVARGLYFVRVVGTGIDETRKVMCVK